VISPVDLLNALVGTFQKIPELVAVLSDGTNSIVPYIDINGLKNSVAKARYQIPAGSLLVVYTGFKLAPVGATIEAWKHAVIICLKAKKGESELALIPLLMNGIPVPGDGLRWHYCPVLTGLLPTEVGSGDRLTDEEGIDYWVVSTSTQETGDT
jgi:hypothetical protein